MNKTITVIGNPLFAAELATVCSKYSDSKVLIIDADVLHPSLDRLLNVKIEDNKISIKTDNNEGEHSGVLIALDAVNKEMLSRELFMDCLIKKNNLYIMTGNYTSSNYGYFDDEYFDKAFLQIVERAQDIFDVVIIIGYKNTYERWTWLSITKSTTVLIPIQGNVLSIRSSNYEIDLLTDTSEEDKNKYMQLTFEYNDVTDLPLGVIKELCHYKIAGMISYNIERIKHLNKRLPYTKRINKTNIKEYCNLLNTIEIETNIPKRKFSLLFTSLIKNIKRRIKIHGNSKNAPQG